MANEHLQRIPTSSGNKSTYTWSGWIKRNNLGDWERLFSTAGQTMLQITGSSPPDQLRYFHQLSGNFDLRSTALLRDVGSWMHIVFSVDHTHQHSKNRVRIYVNGAELDNYATDSSSNGSQNLETYFNSMTEHALLGREDTNAGENFRGEAFDIFWVDGQALTPDVFGFYKDGDGYQSSGTDRATDFRSGQWSPRLPKSIKHTINRGGGFGVNGFYIPLNDGSNFGADFHCSPNSIIKLKGEDEPQPRNGAPTTSDAYVSQLRSDPFAANLVLAIPGISTATGSNLITNGNFDSDISGWTASGVQFTHTRNTVDGNAGGKLMYFATGTNITRNIYQNITTETGKRYTLSFDASSDQGSANTVKVNGTSLVTITDNNNGTLIHHNTSFTAASTSTEIKIESTISNRSYYDNFVVKQEDAPRDYSADIKGSGTNKTLTANGNAGVGYDLGGYYGSAMTFDGTGDVLSVPNNSDFNFSDGSDFTIELWLYRKDTGGNDGIINIFENTAGTRRTWVLEQRANQAMRFEWWSDGSSGTNITTDNNSLPINQWSHICAERSGSRITLYINGVVAGLNESAGSIYNNTVDPLRIGAINQSTTAELNANIQDIRIYKGLAKYKGSFDVPKPYSPIGIEAFRTTSDNCKNNFATLNSNAAQGTYTNGDLTAAPATNVSYSGAISNFMVSSGKWYCEFRCDEESTGAIIPGIIELENLGFRDIFGGSNFFGQSIEANDTAGARFDLVADDGDIVSMYMDLDSSPITLSLTVNGGSATTYSSDSLSQNYNNLIPGRTYGFVAADAQSGTVNIKFTFNFGQNPTFCGQTTAGTFTDSNGKGLFKYQPPTGFLALCDDNLPTPAVADPGKHFKAVLWNGDGQDGRAITKVGFKPDLVWIANRDRNTYKPVFDVVRGATNMLRSNTNSAQGSFITVLQSFDSDGFTVGDDGAHNFDGERLVAWCWKAGGSAVTNNVGSVTSTVSANPEAGFSIIKFTAQTTANNITVGHGLGNKPCFWIYKPYTNTTDWYVYHQSLGSSAWIKLDSDVATTGNAAAWGGTDPTDTVLTHGSGLANQGDCILYAWAEIEGYSKFGSYTGNNDSTNGPFVYCGFKPAWILVKCTSTTGSHWIIYDSSRSSKNVNGLRFGANLTDFENMNDTKLGTDSSVGVDFLSNGFKIKTQGINHNGDGDNYIFAAFAESPFQTANAK